VSIMAIDPGPTQSAYVVLDLGYVVEASILPNDLILDVIENHGSEEGAQLAVEMVASYGMAVGKEVFETVYWIGRFCQRWGDDHHRVYRKDVKLHLCNSMKAKDANIRQALLDRFGGKAAIGTKKQPGPLYGVKADIWAALAVAVTFADKHDLTAA
jgi:hypothetical protein